MGCLILCGTSFKLPFCNFVSQRVNELKTDQGLHVTMKGTLLYQFLQIGIKYLQNQHNNLPTPQLEELLAALSAPSTRLHRY